jgi:hypothetical protein
MEDVVNIERASEFLSHPSWDIIVIFFFISVGFFYGISAGIKKMLSALFSLYLSVLLLGNFSFFNYFKWNDSLSLLEIFLIKIFLFLIIFVLLFVLLNRSVFKSKSIDQNDKWWQIFVLSFLETGLLMSAIFQLLPAKELFTFSPLVKFLFVSSRSFFIWLTLPLTALFFIIKSEL